MTLILFFMLAQNARVQSTAASIDGVYNGIYICTQGPTKFKLSLTPANDGSLAGVFTLYPTRLAPREFTFDLSGTYEPTSRRFQLRPIRWETPSNLGMFALSGTYEPTGGGGAGQANGVVAFNGCTTFDGVRDRAESARIVSVIAAQKAGRTGTPPPQQTTAGARTASPTDPGPASGGGQVPRGRRTVSMDDGTTITVPTPKPAPPASAASKPIDMEWMKEVRLKEPEFVRGLVLGDFRPLAASRLKALAYIDKMNSEFAGPCPGVFRADVSQKAGVTVAAGLLQLLQRGQRGTVGTANDLSLAGEAGRADAHPIADQMLLEIFEIDYREICDVDVIEALAANMRRFVGN